MINYSTTYNTSSQRELNIVPSHRTFSGLILLPLLRWKVSGFFYRKLSLISTQLITSFFLWWTVILFFSNLVSLDQYLSSDSIVLIGVIFIMEALHSSIILGNYITQYLAKKVGRGCIRLIIYTNIIVTAIIYFLICSDMSIINLFEVLLGLRLAAFITRFIYLTSLDLNTYLKMFIFRVSNGDIYYIVALLINIMNLYFYFYKFSISLEILHCLIIDTELFSDFWTVKCADGPSSPNDNPQPNPEGSKPDPGKKPKPDLHIDIGPKTDQEKDTFKIGNCLHENFSHFQVDNEKDAKETLCDFTHEEGPDGKPLLHKAFNSVRDVALVCNDCSAIQCENCTEDYSSSENTSPNR